MGESIFMKTKAWINTRKLPIRVVVVNITAEVASEQQQRSSNALSNRRRCFGLFPMTASCNRRTEVVLLPVINSCLWTTEHKFKKQTSCTTSNASLVPLLLLHSYRAFLPVLPLSLCCFFFDRTLGCIVITLIPQQQHTQSTTTTRKRYRQILSRVS